MIDPKEVDTIDVIGKLNGSDVKLVRTKGGFHVAIGKATRSGQETALSAGSHPAIVKYNVEKAYPSFELSMAKSESEQGPEVRDLSSGFRKEIYDLGYGLYSLTKGEAVEFRVTKHDVDMGSIGASVEGDTLSIKNKSIRKSMIPAGLRKSIAEDIAKIVSAHGKGSKLKIKVKIKVEA